jgi:hypothetical protein
MSSARNKRSRFAELTLYIQHDHEKISPLKDFNRAASDESRTEQLRGVDFVVVGEFDTDTSL